MVCCYSCCGKIQDCCRDVCGCCPCKCCKTKIVKIEPKKLLPYGPDKKEIPFGNCLIYPGARTAAGNYTCSVIEIHTWRRADIYMPLNKASLTQRVALGGIQIKRDNADRHLGPLRGATQRCVDVDEKVFVIPIETILSITSSSEVQKEEIERRNVRSRSPSSKLSCCEKIRRLCCRCSKNRFSKRQEELISTFSNQQAQRKVLMAIEYIQYSNIDSPSHVHLLSPSKKTEFFDGHFKKESLEFYLMNDNVFEQYDFDLKREQAATLCRLVTQLKAMVGHYPDELTLERIIGNPDILAVGNPADENFIRMASPGIITDNFGITINERF